MSSESGLPSAIDALEAFRILLLPVQPAAEPRCVEVLRAALADIPVQDGENADWVQLQLEEWASSGSPSAALADVTSAILRTGADRFGGALAATYFRLHSELIATYCFTHGEARLFLSYGLTMARLVTDDQMTGSQVAKLLSERDARIRFTWQPIQRLLSLLDVKPELNRSAVDALIQRDQILDESLFADGDVRTCAEVVAVSGERFGYAGDLLADLSSLYTEGATTNFNPYLQILHMQCAIAEFHDHAVTHLYEFAPRGWIGELIPNLYRGSFEGSTGNPVLNNAKKVYRLDFEWALGADPQQQVAARSLVRLLEGLERMGFAARRELAGWIRRWLMRVIRVNAPLQHRIRPVTAAQARRLFGFLRSQNTATRGVVEQRVVDIVAMRQHPASAGWRSRGLGDSVNATNVSRRKLGDCAGPARTLGRVGGLVKACARGG